MRELQVWKGIVLYESIWVRLPRYRSERDCRCRVFVILFYLGKIEMMRMRSKRTSVEIASSARSMLIWFVVFCVCGGQMRTSKKMLHDLKRDERCTNVNTKGRVLKYLANISDDSRDVLYRHFVMADSDEM